MGDGRRRYGSALTHRRESTPVDPAVEPVGEAADLPHELRPVHTAHLRRRRPAADHPSRRHSTSSRRGRRTARRSRSPAGTSRGDVGNIHILDLSTHTVRGITHGEGYDHQVAWSPGGHRLVFETRLRPHVTDRVDPTGRIRRTLPHLRTVLRHRAGVLAEWHEHRVRQRPSEPRLPRPVGDQPRRRQHAPASGNGVRRGHARLAAGALTGSDQVSVPGRRSVSPVGSPL